MDCRVFEGDTEGHQPKGPLRSVKAILRFRGMKRDLSEINLGNINKT